jgi:hypothetical protein
MKSTTFHTYTCHACEHEWECAVTEDSGTREMAPESDAPSVCPVCDSDTIESTSESFDDPGAEDRDEG